jgi:sugar lactone lactonase YvrE
VSLIIEVSYSQPKLPSCACWNPDGTTFANQAVAVNYPSGLFVDRNNTVYMSDISSSSIRIWHEGSTTVTRTIFNTLAKTSNSLFVNIGGDIYVGSDSVGAIGKWTLNSPNSIAVINVTIICYGLFVDIRNYLYCSSAREHRVTKQSLDVGTNVLSTVAGNGSQGSTSNMLSSPQGIFVNINFDVYVADSRNDRVQLFKFGQLNGITVAGSNAKLSVVLSYPTAVFLDSDSNLFVVDTFNQRIVGSTPNGFYCVVGCSGIEGTQPYHLYNPHVAAFDNHGNIFVNDYYNNRIQKFLLMKNTIGK